MLMLSMTVFILLLLIQLSINVCNEMSNIISINNITICNAIIIIKNTHNIDINQNLVSNSI